MEGRLDAQRAEFIAQVCKTNSWFDVPLEEKGIGRDEWESFLRYAVEAAQLKDNREAASYDGSVDVEITFVSHRGKVGQDEEKWDVMIPHRHTDKVLAVAGGGKVIATITPEQLTIPIDADTGEIL